MAQATPKLTPQDIIWLEHRLSAAVAPVAPRPEFVRRAKQELMDSPITRPLPGWIKRSILAAVVLSTLSLVATLLYLRRRG